MRIDMSRMASVGRIYNYSPEHRRTMGIGVALALASTLIFVYCPKLLADVMGDIEADLGSSVYSSSTLETIILLIVLCILAFLLSTGREWFIMIGAIRLGDTFRNDLFEKTCRLPFGFFLRIKEGDVTSRMANDTYRVVNYSGKIIYSAVTAVAGIIGSAVMMLITNTELAVASIFPIASGLMIMLFMTRRTQRYFVEEQRVLGETNSRLIESFHGHSVIKTFCAEKEAEDDFREVNGKLIGLGRTTGIYTSLFPAMMGFVTNICYITVCGYGMVMVLDGRAEFGQVVAFLVYVKLFTDYVLQMSRAMTSYAKLSAAATRIFEILDAEEMEERDMVDLGDVRGEIEFDHLSFSYDGVHRAIDDVSLRVEPGQKVAIVGFSGSGKTTLMNLMMGFYDYQEGDIRIDGHSIKKLNYFQVHSLFSLVTQDNWVFRGTFRENIVYTSEPRSDEELLNLCDSIGLTFIRNRPQGLDTMIENSDALSAGQRQQVAIARAALRNAPILVLDEATSSVDMKSEKAIVASLNSMSSLRTSFVIAHRLSTVNDADIIVVLENGRITESGTPKELMESHGFYYELNMAQYGKQT